jgi:chromosome segregation ATPase
MNTTSEVNGSKHDQHFPNDRRIGNGNATSNSNNGSETTSFALASDQYSLDPPYASSNDASLDSLLSPQWSSAVGRATTGKSGRVIEKLMAENDRLRRELKLETLRREEEQKRGEMARGKMESLQNLNDNLIHQTNVDKASLARRERKIEDLKADIETERKRRVEAESGLKQVQRESDATIQELKSNLVSESEKARKSSSQYDVLASSWKQLDDGYRRKTDAFRKELQQLKEEKNEDRAKLARLEIIVEQQRQEVEKMRLVKERMERQYEDYIEEAETSTRDMKEKAGKNERENEKALEETKKVLGELRYLINLKKFVRDAD